MNQEYKFSRNSKGYVILISVIIIAMIGLVIAVSLISLSLGFSQSSFSQEKSGEAKSLADACVEEALKVIKATPDFSGTDNLSTGNGSCTYTVEILTGENRNITASGSVDIITRKVKVSIDQITPAINVVSWEELADF